MSKLLTTISANTEDRLGKCRLGQPLSPVFKKKLINFKGLFLDFDLQVQIKILIFPRIFQSKFRGCYQRFCGGTSLKPLNRPIETCSFKNMLKQTKKLETQAKEALYITYLWRKLLLKNIPLEGLQPPFHIKLKKPNRAKKSDH